LLLKCCDAIGIERRETRAVVVLRAHVGVVEDAQRLKVDGANIVSETQAVGVIEPTSIVPIKAFSDISDFIQVFNTYQKE
jgi:hypothetical protein